MRQRRFGSTPSRSTASRSGAGDAALWKCSPASRSAASALLERDVRPRRLKVEEALGVDVREALRAPGLRQVAGRRATRPGRRRSSPGRRRQHGPLERRRLDDPSSSPSTSLRRGARPGGARARDERHRPRPRPPRRAPTWTSTSHHGSSFRHWISPTAICTRISASRPRRRVQRARRRARGRGRGSRARAGSRSRRRPSRGRGRRRRRAGSRSGRCLRSPECGPAAVENVPVTTSTQQAAASTSPAQRSHGGTGGSTRPRAAPHASIATTTRRRARPARAGSATSPAAGAGRADRQQAERRLRDRPEERRARRPDVTQRGRPGVRRAASQARSVSAIGTSATTRLPNSTTRGGRSPGRTRLLAARARSRSRARSRQPHDRAGEDDQVERERRAPRAAGNAPARPRAGARARARDSTGSR